MNYKEAAKKQRRVGHPLVGLKYTEYETGPDPEFTVIWLHGSGPQSYDSSNLPWALQWPYAPPLRFIFPQAPVRKITLLNDEEYPAWYDLVHRYEQRDHDYFTIVRTINQVAEFVGQQEARGIPSETIVLGGLTQGGAIAVQVAIRYPRKLLGVAVASSFTLMTKQMKADLSEANGELPVFVGHCMKDTKVPYEFGRELVETLEDMELPVTHYELIAPHGMFIELTNQMSLWLQDRVTPDDDE